jgi:eukaryotic-like serine/threonine-protein kinase
METRETRSPAQPPRQAIRATSGLTWRIFIATASIVGAVLAVTLVLSYIAAQRQASATLGAGIDRTAARVANSFDASAADLIDKTGIYAGNPIFRSTIEQAKDSGDYLDQAQTMAEAIGASWVQLIDRDGILLARSDEPGAEGADLTASKLVSVPLETGTPKSGFGVTKGTTLFQAAGVPIMGAGNVPVGVVMASRDISDTLAAQLAKETGSEIVFFTLDSTGGMLIVGASDGIKDRAEVKNTLEPLILGATPSDTASAGAAAPGDSLAKGTAMTPMREGRVGGVRYAWSTKPLTAAGGRVVGGVIALLNKDEVLADFRRTQWMIFGLGVLAILLSFAVSLAIARQITRPVRALVDATSRASEGDYAAEIPASGRDEIGSLAAAFRQLLADLREKQAVVEFLQNPAGGRTVPVQAVTPSLQAMMAGANGMAVLEPGQLLAARYEIKAILGVGGMGMVYKAIDRELGDVVAVKTLKPDMIQHDPAALDRFRSEIRLARRISHRNVVRTHDIGESGGLYYITMEFVEGKSLKELIVSRGRLPAAAVLPIAKQLCRALDVAHEAGVIHRDIKPQNMVVEPDGVLKVMDFGIARMAQRTEGHTQAGMVVGTPEYMAPEQLLGDDIDARADLYAVGVVLYESLTGRLPHIADTPISLIAKVLDETPTAPRTMSDDIPASLSDIVMRTLAKDRGSRPQSASELLAMLERV